jgi:predicted Zn-dependent protease with MMP-like domain
LPALYADERAWVNKAATLGEFETLVERVFQCMPADWRARCAGVSIQVRDQALPDAVEPWERADRDVLGSFCRRLYHPPIIWLYRAPILAFASDHSLPLAVVIEMVLTHEVFHAMGLSDVEMALIEAGEI